MKEHLINFASEAAAIADATFGALYIPIVLGEGGGWSNIVTPSVGVWSAQVAQSGFWMIVATDEANTALAQHTNCRLAWDSEDAVILGGTWTGNEMSAVYVSPVPAGAYNPWNGPAPE